MNRRNFPTILFGLAFSIAFTIPLSQFVCTRLILITFFFSLFVKKGRSSLFENAYDLIYYLLVLSVGLLYSENIKLGLSVLETNFSCFALPFIFFKIQNFDKVKQYQLFLAFSIGLLLASTISISHSVIEYFSTEDIHAFFFYQLLTFLDFHPTYFGYYIIFAISFGLYLLYFENVQRINYKWILLGIAFLFMLLMFTGGITSFISILLVLSFFILKYIVDGKSKVRLVSFLSVLAMVAIMFAFSFIYKAIDQPMEKVTDNWERMSLWESAIAANSNLLLGVGTGDYKEELNQFYIDHHMQSYAEFNFNSHNQFIQVLFSNGILGLTAVILILSRPLILSLKNQNLLGALVFFPFLIFGFTEVFLGRFQGIVFFVFLHQAFNKLYHNQYSLNQAKRIKIEI